MCFQRVSRRLAKTTRSFSRASVDERLVVTFDRDFGELVTRHKRAAAAGVLLLRFIPRSADEVSGLLVELLARADLAFERRLTVVDRTHLRQRPL